VLSETFQSSGSSSSSSNSSSRCGTGTYLLSMSEACCNTSEFYLGVPSLKPGTTRLQLKVPFGEEI